MNEYEWLQKIGVRLFEIHHTINLLGSTLLWYSDCIQLYTIWNLGVLHDWNTDSIILGVFTYSNYLTSKI